jgi:polyhydroxybutyrate depolymerase
VRASAHHAPMASRCWMILLAACSAPPAELDAATPSDAAPVADGALDAAATCSAAAFAPGDHDYTLRFGGRDRTYHLHVPGSAGALPPLLLNLHPLVLNGPGQALFSNMNAAADERGIVVAYPDGVNGSWNGGSCCGAAAQQGLDDVGFIRAVVEDIAAHGCIDRARVFATGMSNGGYLAQRLGCEASDLIVAIAPAAGVIGIPLDSCRPARPVPVLEFHGTADSLVDYAEVAPTIATWVERNRCTDAAHEIYRQGNVHCEAHEACAEGARVILCTAEGGGHCWPGSATCPVGAPIRDIDGNRYMLDFFASY